MKANSTLLDPIQVDGKCAVMNGEDTGVRATQFRGSDEALAGSFYFYIRIMCASLTIPGTPTGRPEYKKR